MFDIGWSEMFVIVVVALVVIGPKDLPRLIREVGRWTAKARSMAREFQRSFDDMVREAELEDIRKTVEQARPSNLSRTIRDAIDPEGELDEAFVLEEEKRKGQATGQPPGSTAVGQAEAGAASVTSAAARAPSQSPDGAAAGSAAPPPPSTPAERSTRAGEREIAVTSEGEIGESKR